MVTLKTFLTASTVILLATLILPFSSYSQLPDIGFQPIKEGYSNVWIVSNEECANVTYDQGILSLKGNCGDIAAPGFASLSENIHLTAGTRIRIKFSYLIHGSDNVSLFASFTLLTECLPYAAQFLRKEPELHSQDKFEKKIQKTTVVLYLYFGGMAGGPGQLTVPNECKSGDLMGQFTLQGGEVGSKVDISDVMIQTY